MELRRGSSDVVPWGPRTHKDVHIDLHSRIPVHTAKRDTVDFPFVHPAKRGATRTAETHPPSESGPVVRQIVFPGRPREGAGRDLGVR
jgi:hypothetical protein